MRLMKDLDNFVEEGKDGVLPFLLRGDVGILCSPGGYGKSGVSLLMANQIASGGTKDFLGFGPVVGGSAAILTLSDPPYIYGIRQREIVKDCTDEERKLIHKNLFLIDSSDWIVTTDPRDSHDILNILVGTYKKHDNDIASLRLLIIDQLSCWSLLDLNKSKSAIKLMEELRELATALNCAVLVLDFSEMWCKDPKFHSLSRWVATIKGLGDKKGAKDATQKFLVIDKANEGRKLKLELKHCESRVGLLYKTTFMFKRQHKLPDLERALAEKAIDKARIKAAVMATAREKGLEEGREEGARAEKIATAKNLLSLGVPLETISKATGLSLEELTKKKL